jgi:hypothetical protein
MAKPSYKDKRTLEALELRLAEMRTNSKLKRDVTVAVSSEGFFRTGIMTDVVQHAMLLPVLVNHLRLHASLDYFETRINGATGLSIEALHLELNLYNLLIFTCLAISDTCCSWP